ncbi:uncharacterized protein BX663DRAFT_494622 [Cokeromyces recurvatus]|uniref:uncharacterized protein n=1 Tax=Cokeromyces recurvatus TaxID=90255 RepID=UPI00221FCBC4|nr:uncharacterized protein BX663DRAFT_494622 [Cokeromyces recurvatus]KAI7907043.1 hypothetical protein BX663DRAFT_494622 [Cokeromyces recurvatus]
MARPNEYVLKVHGYSLFNVIMQVETEIELIQWNKWFNIKRQSSSTDSLSSLFNNKVTTVADQVFSSAKNNNNNDKSAYRTREKDDRIYNKLGDIDNNRKSNSLSKNETIHNKFDSDITEQLLFQSQVDEESDIEEECEYRRGSTTTVSTLVNCYYNRPFLTELEYGINEITNAHEAQRQRLRQNQMETHSIHNQPESSTTTWSRSSVPAPGNYTNKYNINTNNSITKASSIYHTGHTLFDEELSEDITTSKTTIQLKKERK